LGRIYEQAGDEAIALRLGSADDGHVAVMQGSHRRGKANPPVQTPNGGDCIGSSFNYFHRHRTIAWGRSTARIRRPDRGPLLASESVGLDRENGILSADDPAARHEKAAPRPSIFWD
jgi:hypothetical protein